MREALRQLGNLDLPIPYEIAKNLRRINAALKEPEELMTTTREKYIDKDADGKIIQYALNKSGEIVPFNVDNRKDFEPDTRLLTKITDKTKLKEFEEQMKAIEKDEFEVDFHEVKMSKLAAYLEKQGGKGNLFEPLIERIFVEDNIK
jgi:hypothetical protein